MPFVLMLIGFVFLLFVMSKFMDNSKSRKTNRVVKFGSAIVLGGLAGFFLLMAKNIPVGGLLAILSFMSAQGSLWRIFGSSSNNQPNTDRKNSSTTSSASHSSPMTREEALEILGLSGNPTRNVIKDAHHKMMMKLHPDQGGSDYFASKLNQARDILL